MAQSDEHAEAGLAPVVVKEAEITLDRSQTQLLQDKHDPKEKEVEAHDGLVGRLHVDDGESEGGDADQKDRAA